MASEYTIVTKKTRSEIQTERRVGRNQNGVVQPTTGTGDGQTDGVKSTKPTPRLGIKIKNVI